MSSISHLSLEISPEIQQFLETLPKAHASSSDAINALNNREHKDLISYKLLLSVHEFSKANSLINQPPPIWKLLHSAKIVYPKEVEPVRNPEVEKRVKALKQKFANLEYQRMTSNLVPLGNSPDCSVGLFGNEIKCMNRQFMMVLNFILIVGGAFTFGFYAASIFGFDDVKTSTRLITGFALALVVFFADLYFLLKNVEQAESII
ncbi:hypothetical protein Ciccas_000501 [Cichlidogyrus casuarinus]|uniref:Transmembrane protein 199 n=1 Tax=Cichlidogyrus casuarinus TaxID=1844966 RepID=A0ABD2QQ02_9PLAT